MVDLNLFLPTTKKELELRRWDYVDVILITGDAYIDHPAFGTAIIGRLIEREGFRVAIIAQPNWRDDLRDFKKMGTPRLFFGITSGNMDSMVNHYTAAMRLRSTDAYTPGNIAGFRPDYATKVYAQILRKLYPQSLLILGGIEASMRRFTHYDYWSDQLLPSVLVDSGADLLVYGMGESPLRAILNVFKQKENPLPEDFHTIDQIAFLADKENPIAPTAIRLHSHEHCLRSKLKFAETFRLIETESNVVRAKPIIQSVGEKVLFVNPPAKPLSQPELDAIYDLPFTRLPHPKYQKRGDIPAFTMINASVTIHRGCFGGCSFCTIAAHQGKFIVNRSQQSILKEIEQITKMPYFKGYITDLGGPSANMFNMGGKDESRCGHCRRASCIYPEICPNLNYSHKSLIALYEKASLIPHVKKISIGSGIRYDLLLCHDKQKNKAYGLDEYTSLLIRKHVSGRLKVAPEHTEAPVLACMRKPSFDCFLQFKQKFEDVTTRYQLKQQLIPYFISSHPLCTLDDMRALSHKMKQIHCCPEQVQDFTPTPMTLSSTLFYTGIDPYSGKKCYCATDLSEKKQQNNYFFTYKDRNST
jgi:uncharacterized radical SAM protein YgiQ